MAHFHTNALIGASGADTGGDAAVATKSLRFNPTDSAYLSRTPSSAGNRRTWTWAGWLKVTEFPSAQCVFFGAKGSSGNANVSLDFNTAALRIVFWNGSGVDAILTTTQVFRDPSAWYHVVYAVDTTQATSSNRVKIYVNGTQVTDFSSETYPSQNYETFVNNNTEHNIGRNVGNSSAFYRGYLADIHMVDGSQLDPTSFGAFNSDGVWQASAYSGAHGTNGFHLAFGDSSSNAALGTDSSSNNNTFTVNNLSAAGQVASSAAVLNLPLNSTPFADSSASSATVTNHGSISTTFAASNSFNISTVASLNGSSQRLTTNNNNISFQNDWTVDGYFIIDNGSSGYNALFNSGYGSQTSNYMYIGFDNTNKPYVETSSSGSRTTASNAISKNVWYHIRVIQTGGTITLYINGTSYLTKTAQTTDLSSQGSNTIGSFLDNGNNANNFFGQLGPFRIINDALDAPPSGGEATNAGALSNTGTKTNSAEIDSLFDVPTNGDQSDTGAGGEVSGNYATLNPLQKSSGSTLSNGNLDISMTSAQGTTFATMAFPASGKWYFECTANNTQCDVGIAKADADLSQYVGKNSSGYGYYNDGNVYHNDASVGSGASYTTGDVVGVAFDADAGTVKWYKNNSLQVTVSSLSGEWFPAFGSGNAAGIFNFGSRPFAYSAPSNHKALCTTNLPTPTIADGSDYFDAVTYTGTASTNAITGLGFSPDWLWIKGRSAALWHNLFDTVRGNNKILYSNATNAEESEATASLTSFDSNGFTLSSNTDGSITSSVRANASAGVSIVGWAGTGVGSATVGHGLNAAPKIVIIKNRTNTSDWAFYNTLIDGSYDYLYLNNTDAKANSGWNAPTNSVFTASNASASSTNVIAYCFTPVSGYSSFGVYTGSGSNDGRFVFTGFAVRWLLIKCTSAAGQEWVIIDSARSPFNVADDALYANDNAAEATNSTRDVDLLSNGFKLRNGSSGATDFSGRTYIYMAFASNPFQTNGGLAR